MNSFYEHKDEIVKSLKILWDYMRLQQPLEKCDLIIGCGCSNLDIPVKCSQLFKDGYGSKILFAGGLGKLTENYFNKPEAEIYKDIAISCGVDESNILTETKSTNTGDNFRFSIQLLEKFKINYNKILIVHSSFSERRTLSSAKAIIKGKEIFITSPNMSFDECLMYLERKNTEAIDIISVIVGDVQRLIIYPQFGWQIENEIPISVLNAYNFLKNIGFNKYILMPNQIDDLIKKFGLAENQDKNYFN